MSTNNNETIEVPKQWLERLMTMARHTSNIDDVDEFNTQVTYLIGYIESADYLLKKEKS